MREKLTRAAIVLVIMGLITIGIMDLFGQNLRSLFGAAFVDSAGSTNVVLRKSSGDVHDYTGKKVHYELRAAEPDRRPPQ